MAQTHDGPFGFFWYTTRLDGAPRLHKAPAYEIEWPYRRGNTVIVRLARSLGIVLGFWRESEKEEHEALLDALNGRDYAELRNDELTFRGSVQG